MSNEEVSEYNAEKESEDIKDTSKLKSEILSLKKAVEEALFQIRLLLSDLDNPFKYIAKEITSEREVKEIKIEEKKEEEANKLRKEVSVSKEAGYKGVTPTSSSDSGLCSELKANVLRSINERSHEKCRDIVKTEKFIEIDVEDFCRGLLVAEFLSKLFGREKLRKIAYAYLEKGFIDQQTFFILIEALEKIANDTNQVIYQFKPEDHIIAIYLLNCIKNPNPTLLNIILALLYRFYGNLTVAHIIENSNLEEGV